MRPAPAALLVESRGAAGWGWDASFSIGRHVSARRRPPPRAPRRRSMVDIGHQGRQSAAETCAARSSLSDIGSPFSCRCLCRASSSCASALVGQAALGQRIIDQDRHRVRRRLAEAHVARDHGVVDQVAQSCRARPPRPAADKLLRLSYMVNTIPSIRSSGLAPWRTSRTVRISCDRPSSAKNSHCSGTSTECAATSALIVRRLSDGGQSIRTKSNAKASMRAGAARHAAESCAFRSPPARYRPMTDRSSRGKARGRSTCVGRMTSTSVGILDQEVIAGLVAIVGEARRGRSRRCPAGQGRRAARCGPTSASAAARLIAVVVLPTPPFWLAMARIRGPGGRVGSDTRDTSDNQNCGLCGRSGWPPSRMKSARFPVLWRFPPRNSRPSGKLPFHPAPDAAPQSPAGWKAGQAHARSGYRRPMARLSRSARRVSKSRCRSHGRPGVRNAALRRSLSTRVTCRPGRSVAARIAATMPGNPPPLPRSPHRVPDPARSKICAESGKWRDHIALAVDDATMLIAGFHFLRSAS